MGRAPAARRRTHSYRARDRRLLRRLGSRAWPRVVRRSRPRPRVSPSRCRHRSRGRCPPAGVSVRRGERLVDDQAAAGGQVPPPVQHGHLIPAGVDHTEVGQLGALPVAFPVEFVLEGGELLEFVAIIARAILPRCLFSSISWCASATPSKLSVRHSTGRIWPDSISSLAFVHSYALAKCEPRISFWRIHR